MVDLNSPLIVQYLGVSVDKKDNNKKQNEKSDDNKDVSVVQILIGATSPGNLNEK